MAVQERIEGGPYGRIQINGSQVQVNGKSVKIMKCEQVRWIKPPPPPPFSHPLFMRRCVQSSLLLLPHIPSLGCRHIVRRVRCRAMRVMVLEVRCDADTVGVTLRFRPSLRT